ncbi:MAG: hypothetical protein ACWGQW_09245, partial [bacterium]
LSSGLWEPVSDLVLTSLDVNHENEAVSLLGDTATARPYIAIWNQNASGILTRKGYFGYPDAHNNASAMALASDQGALNLYSSASQNINLYGSLGVYVQGTGAGPHLTVASSGQADEGGQINLEGGTSWSSNPCMIDNYQGALRLFAGTGKYVYTDRSQVGYHQMWSDTSRLRIQSTYYNAYPVVLGELYSEAAVGNDSAIFRVFGSQIRFTNYGDSTYGLVGSYGYQYNNTGWCFTHNGDTDTGLYYAGSNDFYIGDGNTHPIRITPNVLGVQGQWGNQIYLYSNSDTNHRLYHEVLAATSVHPSSGIASNGPSLQGYSSVLLKCALNQPYSNMLWDYAGRGYGNLTFVTFSRAERFGTRL